MTGTTSQLYEMLFCDNPQLFRPKEDADYPWNVLYSEPVDKAGLEKIAGDPQEEARVRILACHRLVTGGHDIGFRELLGVVVEIGLEGGPDVLACYCDGTARYINQSGKIIIWETANDISLALTRKLFNASIEIVKQIGPSDQPRRLQPIQGIARITFLVSHELYFGEAPIDLLFNDPMAGRALGAATEMMQFIIGVAE